MYKHILVAYEGSALSDKAVAEAIRFAKQTGCKVSLLHVLTPHHILVSSEERMAPGLKKLEREHAELRRQQAGEMLERARERLTSEQIECEALLEEGRHPYQQIVQVAKRQGCDLIFMATHGRSGIEGLVVGSQTIKVLANTEVPVLAVR